MPAGYSGTPLVRKLGIKPGHRIRLVNTPDHYLDLVGPLPDDAVIAAATRGSFDFIHGFFTSQRDLSKRLGRLHAALKPAGMLWLSWPKGASSIETDLNREIIRELGLADGLVDVKVCAVDEDWSGLKFVIPVADR